jgi:flagellar biosynthesis regulator FlaF
VRPQAAGNSSHGRRIADGINNITDEELNHRFSVFGIQLSLRDLDNLAPSFYNAQRDELRSFLRLNFFRNEEINEESVAVAIREILQNLDRFLDRLSAYSHPDYDVRKSVENLIMKSLPFIINLITDDSSSEFGARIERQLIVFCENVYMILVKCIGVRDTEKYLNEVANMVMTGQENAGNMARFPRYIIQTFLIERRSYDLSEIQEFLVVKRPSAPTVSFEGDLKSSRGI